MNTPNFYIIRYEGTNIEESDYDWFLADSEEDAINTFIEMYKDNYEDLSAENLEVYCITDGSLWGCNGKKYQITVQEVKPCEK